MSVLVTILIFATFLYSVILHELAHGYVALKCGDPTAKWAGRLTLNPVSHIDPMMSIIVPILTYMATGVVFGGAKPVPVTLNNLRRYPRDWILVSIAGVATNLLIAISAALLFHALRHIAPGVLLGSGALLGQVLLGTVYTNLVLVVFNLIPIPPLDGSRAFRFLLRGDLRRSYDSLERYGFIILILFINTPAADWVLGTGVGTLAWLLGLSPRASLIS